MLVMVPIVVRQPVDWYEEKNDHDDEGRRQCNSTEAAQGAMLVARGPWYDVYRGEQRRLFITERHCDGIQRYPPYD